MWCVVYPGEGREQRAEEFIKGRLPETVCRRCFHVVRRLAYRKQGRVWEAAQSCFPGYVFIETEDSEVLQKALRDIRGNFLPGNPFPFLDREDETLLDLLCDQEGEIGLSVARVSIDGESGKKEAKFLSGPLSRVADKVAQIDLHKRYARLKGRFPGGKGSLQLGFCLEGEEPCIRRCSHG